MSALASAITGRLLVGVVCAALGLAGGYAIGYRHASAQGSVALEQLGREHAEQQAEHDRIARYRAEQATKDLQNTQALADGLAAQLAEEQRRNRVTSDHLKKEIDRVSSLYRRALDAPPEPVPACVFTRGWVRLYDQATGAELPAAAADPAGAAAPAGETGAAEQLDTGIGQARVLAHHIGYAEQCRNTAAQLDRLIDLLESR
ncbi:MAG: hypothetical protein NDI93_01965 [Pseudomonas sp.]|nr:hypothetical protein [Pseudomonas sp.]